MKQEMTAIILLQMFIRSISTRKLMEKQVKNTKNQILLVGQQTF